MPIEPNEDFIPRDLPPEIQEILNQYSSVLEELVNFASVVARWCAEEIHGGEELAPLHLSFRHIFELIDTIYRKNLIFQRLRSYLIPILIDGLIDMNNFQIVELMKYKNVVSNSVLFK